MVGTNFVYADANGYLWQHNEDSGVAITVSIGLDASVLYFAGPGCAGTPYVRVANGTRAPFRVTGDASWHVRSDSVAGVAMVPGSTKSLPDGACSSSVTWSVNVVPLSSTVPTIPIVAPTAPPFPLPVHPEWVP